MVTSPGEHAGLRRFRNAAYGVYIAAVAGVCTLVAIGVFRSIGEMSPRRPKATEIHLTTEECSLRVQGLFDELEHERQGLGQVASTRHAGVQWSAFRVEWLGRLRQAEAQCDVDSPERQSLRVAFRQLAHVGDLYTTSSVQFEGEIGPSVDALRKTIAESGSSSALGHP
jgi:hypothetical protein